MSRHNELIRRLLSGLTDSELKNLVRVREEERPIPAPRRQREARPIPTPMRNVQQLIRHFENEMKKQNEKTATSASTKDKNW